MRGKFDELSEYRHQYGTPQHEKEIHPGHYGAGDMERKELLGVRIKHRAKTIEKSHEKGDQHEDHSGVYGPETRQRE